MGNAAAVQTVAESSRRRLLLQQYNRQPKNVLISRSLVQAFEYRRFQPHHVRRSRQSAPEVHEATSSKTPLQSLPLYEIFDVLTSDFGVQLTLEELPIVLRHLGCQLVEPPKTSLSPETGEEWYSVQELVGYVEPRRILRQVKRRCESPSRLKFSHNNVTIWQAAKMGNTSVLQAVCAVHGDAYRARDDFDNSPLYYASLCGREVVVDFVLRAYERECRKITPDELLRCVTNALTPQIRALLQQKVTLEEVLRSKEKDFECDKDSDNEDEAGGAWFGFLADDVDK
ncbi:unnamed protein product [Phytophthora fragariaefolia]|uniref:Unnamed protein product n=1 Tax=Phytophthora fragariaefolia TaxID=1490495 RepID=A0A9W7CZP5_9STRA|nr:unnamed protein product [Phytophthora fragariaefolia]